MRLALYAHPFDLRALSSLGGLARLADLGFVEVAMATAYHDGRWLQPWHPAGRVRFLEDGTVHFRPTGDYGVLVPAVSSEVPAAGPSPLERLCADAAPLGLSVRAWTVFTHNSRLGARHPDLCVQNAFGDRYPYALCPSQPAVQHYIGAMIRDLDAHAALSAIECEALGQMGWKHSSHHDKASFLPAGLFDAALSACFCPACAAILRGQGGDPDAVRELVRGYLEARLAGDAMAPVAVPSGPAALADEPGAERWLGPVLAVRAATVQRLADLLRAQGRVARAIQVHPHPWFTGSQLAAATAAAFAAGDERVITCYGDGPDAIQKTLLALPLGLRAAPLRVCVWPKAPQFRGDDDLLRLRDVLATHGVGALAIYHLGLLPWRTLERVARVFAA